MMPPYVVVLNLNTVFLMLSFWGDTDRSISFFFYLLKRNGSSVTVDRTYTKLIFNVYSI